VKIILSDDRISKHYQAGFSMIEVMIVITLIAILTAVAMPAITQMRQNIEYRRAARDIASMLRDARNRTITTNLQYGVAFPTNKKYVLQRGDRAYNTLSTNWTDMNSVSVVSQVTLTGPARIAFNPNGTTTANASLSAVVQDTTGQAKYTITVLPAGKIKITP
jgi:type IV fimbrial biogenesis protein FimT